MIPVWEHTKKHLIPEWDTLEEDRENCNLESGRKVVELYPEMEKMLNYCPYTRLLTALLLKDQKKS